MSFLIKALIKKNSRPVQINITTSKVGRLSDMVKIRLSNDGTVAQCNNIIPSHPIPSADIWLALFTNASLSLEK